MKFVESILIPMVQDQDGNHKEVMSMQDFCLIFTFALLLIAAWCGVNRGGGPTAF